MRSSWSVEDACAAETQHLGVTHSGHDDLAFKPIPAIDGPDARRLFRVRAELFEGGCKPTSGLVYQELPRALLANGMFEPLRPALAYLQSIIPEIDLSSKEKFDMVSAAYHADPRP